MSTTFKVGDRVEFTENYMEHKVGERFTVTAVQSAHFGGYTQLVQGRKPGNFTGVVSERLKLVVEAPKFKKGDRVQITIPEGDSGTYGGHFFNTGAGTVAETQCIDYQYVKVIQDNPRLNNNSEGEGWLVLQEFVTPLVEQRRVKVGDTIEALEERWSGRVKKGARMIVAESFDSGAVSARVENSWDSYPWHMREGTFKLVPTTPVVERPKATPVTADTKPQIGDTIVAFWGDLSKGEVETRAKGVVARIDEDGNYEAADGSYIDWDSELTPETSDSVFIVERAPKPKPEPVKELPNPLETAPVGSKADDGFGLAYIKTLRNEWKLITIMGLESPRTSKELFEQFNYAGTFGLTVLA